MNPAEASNNMNEAMKSVIPGIQIKYAGDSQSAFGVQQTQATCCVFIKTRIIKITMSKSRRS